MIVPFFISIIKNIYPHTNFMSNKNLSVEKKSKEILSSLQNNSDVIAKYFFIAKTPACLIFVDEIVKQDEISLNIINPLNNFVGDKKKIDLDSILNKNVSLCNASLILEDEILIKILKGYAVLLVENCEGAIAFNVVGYEQRSVEEPPSSTVISGPREGFTESIKTNIGLIRKRLVSKKLKIEDCELGERTKTAIKLVYFDDLVDSDIVAQIKKRISRVKIDGVIDSYYIGTILENKPNSIFRQVGNCEKPDIACSKILEGRVAILVDGSPIVLTVPFVLIEDFQSSNDYYSESHRSSMLRVLRIIALIMSIYFPAMFIALQLYHYKVLPLKFLVTIIDTTQNLPLNPFLEVFFIIILFDILFEASIRMPKYLGIAVSIVGALILGDTAVKAGLVSPPGVMIVAMSAITIYIIPNQSSQISILRFIFAFIGGTLGFHGIIIGSMFLVAYLCNFDCFGTPYFAPYSPFVKSDQKDAFIKENIFEMRNMPQSFPNQKERRFSIENKKRGNKK